MIWLVGNKGMLGSEVEKKLQNHKFEYFGTDLDYDITDIEVLKKITANKKIDWIINCSAYTAVDKAEVEKYLAEKVNVKGVENLACVSKECDAKLIHISTDYVFNGKKKNSYVETDPIEPLGIYGRTKAEGEKKISRNWNKYFIIRTAWLYGMNGKNFVSTMLNLFNEKEEIGVIGDQWGAPTYAVDLAEVILEFIQQQSTAFGIYHFSNEEKTNWFGFAQKILKQSKELGLLRSECKINNLTTKQYPTKVKRPEFAFFDKTKIKRTLGIKIRSWQDALNDYLKELV